MDFYQRLGIFLTRLIALVTTGMGVMGFLDYMVLRMQGSPDASERLGVAATWTISGLVVFAFNNGIGRLLGKGLGEDKTASPPDDIE